MSFEIYADSFVIDKKNLIRTATAAFIYLKLKNPEIELIFVDEKCIKRLNDQYRSIDKATDVLSFIIEKKPLIGQIFICYNKAKKQAISNKKSLDEEIINLFIHGLIHLCGYDHTTQAEADKMEKIEQLLIK